MVEEMRATFLGERMSQHPRTIEVWESILKEIAFSRIIELGTWWGNFSLYLHLYCIQRDAQFHTFDVGRQRSSKLKRMVGFDKTHTRADVFHEYDKVVSLLKRNGTSILFCDNGDKEREFNLFKPHLKKGDYIAVHDWLTEVHPDNLDTAGLTEVFPQSLEINTKFYVA